MSFSNLDVNFLQIRDVSAIISSSKLYLFPFFSPGPLIMHILVHFMLFYRSLRLSPFFFIGFSFYS